jgi:CRP-like cAMP-binding protein
VPARRERADAFLGVELFSRCTASVRRSIARHAQIVDVPEGATLVREGETADALFVIIDGEATVFACGAEVGRLAPGAHFGEVAVLDGGPQSASVVAATDTRVGVIGIRMFRLLLREYPDLAEQLLVSLAGELRTVRRAVDGC